MRRHVRGLGLIFSVAMGLLWAGGVDAASINVSPTTVPAGGTVTVSGDALAPGGQPGCAVPGTVSLFSVAFGDINTPVQTTAAADAKYSVVAQIPAGVAPGAYPVTGRCGGGNLGVEGTVVVTAAQLPATGTGGLLPSGTGIPSPAQIVVVVMTAAGLIAVSRLLRRRSA